MDWDYRPGYKFQHQDMVKHLKTEDLYSVLEVPDEDIRLEACNEPYYAYRKFIPDMGLIGPVWIRRKSEMEDGRFVKVAYPAIDTSNC